jgi:hypothetical protein
MNKCDVEEKNKFFVLEYFDTISSLRSYFPNEFKGLKCDLSRIEDENLKKQVKKLIEEDNILEKKDLEKKDLEKEDSDATYLTKLKNGQIICTNEAEIRKAVVYCKRFLKLSKNECDSKIIINESTVPINPKNVLNNSSIQKSKNTKLILNRSISYTNSTSTIPLNQIKYTKDILNQFKSNYIDIFYDGKDPDFLTKPKFI